MHDLTRLRLLAQRLHTPPPATPRALVAHMGAMQAQNEAMSKLAVSLRAPGADLAAVQAALDSGAVIRTHALRPTWHLVAAEDLRWLLALGAPQVKALLRPLDQQVGVTEHMVQASQAACHTLLAGGRAITREDLSAALIAMGIPASSGALTHLLMYAEQDAVLCSGPAAGGRNTYALVDERVPAQAPCTREEALARLAAVYFRSHGPATERDFAWWSGLKLTECRRGLAAVQAGLVSIAVGGEAYWLDPAVLHAAPAPGRLHLLPAFDEYLISYRDRTAAIPVALQPLAFTSNGIFKPVIVRDGQVVGTWARRVARGAVHLEAQWFAPVGAEDLAELADACHDLAAHWKLPVRCV